MTTTAKAEVARLMRLAGEPTRKTATDEAMRRLAEAMEAQRISPPASNQSR